MAGQFLILISGTAHDHQTLFEHNLTLCGYEMNICLAHAKQTNFCFDIIACLQQKCSQINITSYKVKQYNSGSWIMLCVIVYTYSSVMVAGTKVAKGGAITGTQPIKPRVYNRRRECLTAYRVCQLIAQSPMAFDKGVVA